MSYHIAHHRLLSDHVQHEAIEKHSGQFATGFPDTIVLHYTGSGTLQSAVSTFLDPDVKASTHLIIGRNGSVVQLMPFDRIAWHAGVSEYQGRKDINRYSIGIELENAGKLKKSGDQYVSWFGRAYSEEDVVSAIYKDETNPSFWHRYTEAQITTVMDICKLLCSIYGVKTIVGHDEISPGRKIDPGPAFPLEMLRERLLFNDRQEGMHEYQPTTKLGAVHHESTDLQSAPDHASPVLTTQRVPMGTEINIKGEKNGWYHVSVPIEGWVKKENVKIENEHLFQQHLIDV